jgi:hypothetical protein
MQKIIPVSKHYAMKACMKTEGIAIRAIKLANIRRERILSRLRPFYMKERFHGDHFTDNICNPEASKRR